MTGTRFAPGPSTAYVCDHVMAMTSSDEVDGDLMSRCATGGVWSDLLGAFAGSGAAAVVAHTDDLLRVAVVGTVAVEVDCADGEQSLTGGATWTTHEFPRPLAVTIRRPDATRDEPSYCIDVGAVPASVVTRRIVTADRPSDPFELLFGPTVPRTVEAAAVRPDDGSGWPPAGSGGVLVFSSGDRIVVDRSMVLGRNPRAVDADGNETGLRRVRLTGAGVSRHHAMIRTDRRHVSIDDLGSSNGTWVTRPDTPVTAVRPGHPVDLVPGTVVDLGGDVSFVVEEMA